MLTLIATSKFSPLRASFRLARSDGDLQTSHSAVLVRSTFLLTSINLTASVQEKYRNEIFLCFMKAFNYGYICIVHGPKDIILWHYISDKILCNGQ